MDEAWLASLPRDDGSALEASDEGVGLTALLVSAPAGRVRLFVRPLYLEFYAQDIIRIEEISLPPEARLRAAIAVEVRLRPGAPLLAIHGMETLPAATLGGPIPFALATRPAQLLLPFAQNYRAAEAAYLRRHGLEPKT
jgi:hypothetical protein